MHIAIPDGNFYSLVYVMLELTARKAHIRGAPARSDKADHRLWIMCPMRDLSHSRSAVC